MAYEISTSTERMSLIDLSRCAGGGAGSDAGGYGTLAGITGMMADENARRVCGGITKEVVHTPRPELHHSEMKPRGTLIDPALPEITFLPADFWNEAATRG
jgi:hypothetical protein